MDKVHTDPEDKSGHKGYHGDLSANNILLFSAISELCVEEYAYGRLQLYDSGLSKLASKMSPPPDFGHYEPVENRTCVCSINDNGQVNYASPQTHLWAIDHGDLPQSRWRDIWSFSCVLSEVCVWLIEGEDAVEEFPTAR